MVDSEFIRDQAQEIEQSPSIGVVTKVYEHTSPDDRSNHEANVKLVNEREEFRRIPIHVGRDGHISIPQKGDFVEVGFLGGKTNRPYLAGYAYDSERRAPLGKKGHWRHRFDAGDGDDLYLEAEKPDHSAGDPETVRMAVKEDGLSDPRMAIELDRSGSKPVATIRKDEDVDGNDELRVSVDEAADTATIEGNPNDDGTMETTVGVDNQNQKAFMEAIAGSDVIEITIDQSAGTIDILTKGQTIRVGDKTGTFKKVARKGDPVEVQDPDSGTISGEITGGSANVEST